jgi:hypothetical protein
VHVCQCSYTAQSEPRGGLHSLRPHKDREKRKIETEKTHTKTEKGKIETEKSTRKQKNTHKHTLKTQTQEVENNIFNIYNQTEW